MKLSMAAVPATDEHLRTLKQIGIDHVVHYQMGDLPDSLDELRAIRERYKRFGLAWKLAESGPAVDRIVLGKVGSREQIERYKRTIGHLGQLGVEVIVYNFMPQIGTDAMVVRTSVDASTRGGARTSRFRLSELNASTVTHSETAVPREQMWSNLEHFLGQVIPAAEAAGVRLAAHPDDPPLSPLCGLERILDKEESFDRLLAMSRSEANAVTFCVGCFAELGADVISLLERFGSRIANVHIRNIAGSPEDFVETFPDAGDVDLPAVVRKLHEIGFSGYLRSDHSPRLATDHEETPDGYSLHGHLFAAGYLRGLIQATAPRA